MKEFDQLFALQSKDEKMSFKEGITYSEAALATFQRYFWFLTYVSPKIQQIIRNVKPIFPWKQTFETFFKISMR